MRVITIILAGCLFCLTIGCENSNSKESLTKKLRSLKQEKKDLTRQIELAETEKKQLKEQVQSLSGLSQEVRLENLYELEKIKITRYTNLYDKNDDGKKEKLLVYIQPIDKQGDIVKASGTVDVEIWDLNKDREGAMLGKWQVTPDELKKLWFATLITINYRLTFDVAEKITGNEDQLVVKVTFTDYLSGKILKEQKIINTSSF